MRAPGAKQDRTIAIADLPFVETRQRLFDAIETQEYTFAAASSLRDQLRTAKSPDRLLDLAAEVIIDVWQYHPNVVGLLATLMCDNLDYWTPKQPVLEKLKGLCLEATAADDWSRVAQVEPLAFALGPRGAPDVHASVLDRLVNNPRWRQADVKRVRQYYGSVGNEIVSILRHWRDPYRKGLLRANDVARLMDLLLAQDMLLLGGHGQTFLRLLEEHGKVLEDHGRQESARTVRKFVEALRWRISHPTDSDRE